MAEPAAGLDIRRMLLLGGVVVIILFAGLFFFFRGCVPAARGPSGYTVIYSNLDLRDAANVIVRLKELGIPYEIRERGQAIAVPKDKSDEARLGLAEKNLPTGGAVGWEIFDEARLGATDFDRRIQLIRAISGELSRTIRRIEAVEDARVQIVLPETPLFAAQVAPVTASVMLRLRPGAELSPEKVNGIVHLVASSVENLQPQNVTVVDNTGRILTAGAEVVVSEEVFPPAEARVVATVEVVAPPEVVIFAPEEAKEVSPKVVTALPIQPVLTVEERILLRVRAKKILEANLSGKAQEILNRFYPPNSTIIKVNIEEKNSQKELKKYEDLAIKRITAIILLDKRVALSKELKQSTFKAVAAAIGYNRERGDKILLQKVPFHVATPPPEVVRGEVEKVLPPKVGKPILSAAWLRNIIWIAGIVAVVLIILTVSRIIRRKPEMVVAPIPGAERPPLAAERVSAVENIKSMTESNPERIAELLKSWLTE